MFFISCLILFDKYLFDPQRWSLYGFGLVGGLAVFSGSEASHFRTFIHEFKHALATLFSGGSIKSFKVGKGRGEVQFEIPEEQSHYIPIIDLAPYCMPLFSLPVLVVALIFQEQYSLWLPLALGTALGADIALCWSEIHHHQTDFKVIAGGFIAAALYIGGVGFLWVNACLLWVIGGRNAFVYAGIMGLKIVKMVIDRIQ